MSSPKEFHMDAVYPEPLSRLRRGHGLPNSCSESSTSPSYRRAVRKQMRRGTTSTGGRFRTQPITFHEIQEVDEENLTETEPDNPATVGAASKSESDLKAKFELFYRSIAAPHDKKNSSAINETSTAAEPVSTSTSADVPSAPTPVVQQQQPTMFVPILIKKHHLVSQDDSSTGKRQVSEKNTNFNPKSRPSL